MELLELIGRIDWDSVSATEILLIIMLIVYFRQLKPIVSYFIHAWHFNFYAGKNAGPPLSFKCIKSSGGPVPWTLVGVSRKYPVLYKER